MNPFTFLLLRDQFLTLGSHEVLLSSNSFFLFLSLPKETRENRGKERLEPSRLGLPFRSQISRHGGGLREMPEKEKNPDLSPLSLAFATPLLVSAFESTQLSRCSNELILKRGRSGAPRSVLQRSTRHQPDLFNPTAEGVRRPKN